MSATDPSTPRAAGRPVRDDYELAARYRDENGQLYLTGVQALVRVPFDQMRADRRVGLRTACFVSGYPGSPLGGFDLELAGQVELCRALDVVHRPGLNEELAATAVMGSQMTPAFGATTRDGVVGIWYGKAPGLDRASDALRTASYPGVMRHGGALAYVGDDPACKSSTLPSSSLHTLADLNFTTLYPGTVQEVLDFGLRAIAISRSSGLWGAIKVDSGVADGAGTVEVGADQLRLVHPCHSDGTPYGRATPGSLSPATIVATEREILEVRLPAAIIHARQLGVNQVSSLSGGTRLGIISSGHVYYQMIEALARLGVSENDLASFGVRLLRMGMVYPFDPEIVRNFARGLREVLVVEAKRPFIEPMVRDVLYPLTDRPVVVGKESPDGRPLLPSFGHLDADAIVEPLYARLVEHVDPERLRRPQPPGPARTRLPIIPRTPYFCSGCPHNTSLPAPKGSLVGAGIGCHSMVAFLDPERAGRVTGVTMMGGEGAQWIGASAFVEADHTFQNLGDGTYFHSGSLAIRAAVAAGVNITYKILYNRAVAMTGGQKAVGCAEVSDMTRSLIAEGVKRVIVTTEDTRRYRGISLPPRVEVRDRRRIMEAQEELKATPGVTVLIHDQQCAAEVRRLRKQGRLPDPPTRVVINHRVCEGCGDCGARSNCLSLQPLETEFGEKTSIDQTSCNKDFSCLAGDCPSFLILTPRRTSVRSRSSRQLRRGVSPADGRVSPASLAETIPEPVSIVRADDYSVRMPGIGGTGVVTVAQVLGTAAMLDGLFVSSMDQTGLSQKGGAVVSDLRISSTPLEGSNKIMRGTLDLYLVFDLIAALNDVNLDGTSPDRTVAVVSTTRSATGLQIGRPDLKQPSEAAIREVIDATTRSDCNLYLDSGRLATELFGRATSANLLLLGAAYQLGLIPVSATAIERAVILNGVAVEVNLQAFRWGRAAVVDPAALERATSAVGKVSQDRCTRALVEDIGATGELRRILEVRVSDLIGYQDVSYARRYLHTVDRAMAAEQAVSPGSICFAEAVARSMHKLMAYKDEYEVARLLLSGADRAAIIAAASGEDVKVSWNLHPPLLRGLGMTSKLRLGPSSTPMLRALRTGKRLRGTRFDPFGYSAVRRLERELIVEYERLVEAEITKLTSDRLERATAVASAPDLVRGYEEVKVRNAERYRDRVRELTADNQ